MAFPEIDTGYKPDGALGALYQGYNGANANQMAQLDLIKQFLANQHAQVQNPLDEQTSQQTLDINDYKTAPEYKQAMTNTQIGQSMSNMAAGQTAQGLQPFKQQAEIRDAQNQFQRADQQNGIYQLDDLIQTEQNPLQRMALMKERERITSNLRNTPEFTGKRELRETGTDSAEWITEYRANQARLAAEARASKPVAGPKTFEETLQYFNAKIARGEQLTDEEKIAYKNAADGFNRKTAKPEPQGIAPVMGAGGAIKIEDKKPTTPYSPPGATIKYDSQGNRIQ